MKKNLNLIITTIIGVVLVALFFISKCSTEEKPVIVNEVEPEVIKPHAKKMISGYRKERVVLPSVPEETPTDEGFLVVDGTDSVEFCTDILSGRPYRIIIEGQRRIPLCQLLNEDGDSTETFPWSTIFIPIIFVALSSTSLLNSSVPPRTR